MLDSHNRRLDIDAKALDEVLTIIIFRHFGRTTRSWPSRARFLRAYFPIAAHFAK